MTDQGSAAQVLDYLITEVEKGGTVSFEQQVNGPYCSVSGLGVRAGGYPSIAEALVAWKEGRDAL